MRKIREALRLHADGLSTRKIATSLSIGQSTAGDYLTGDPSRTSFSGGSGAPSCDPGGFSAMIRDVIPHVR